MIRLLHLFLLCFSLYLNAISAQNTGSTAGVSTPPTSLDSDEVEAIKDLLRGLGDPESASNVSSSCPEGTPWQIGRLDVLCSCKIPNETGCHITKIDASSSRVVSISSVSSSVGSTSSFTNGILRSATRLTFLETLVLRGNYLTGQIPYYIGYELKSLRNLNLSWNQLTGTIPYSIGSLSSMEKLDLSANELSGAIPASIGKLYSLQELNLRGNSLTGEIPDNISSLHLLRNLDLSMNKLSGSIPSSIGDLHLLQKLDLSRNQLSGTIPDSIGDLRSLQKLHLYTNLLQGEIPTLENLLNITELWLRYNNLTGSIPHALGNQLLMLQYLDLSENRLNGTLPEALGNLRNLTYLDVGSNFLSGEIPKTFNQLTSIRIFGAYGNNLHGKLNSVTNWKGATGLYLIGNNFDGPLPDDIFMMRNLTELVVSDLNLTFEYGYRFPKHVNFSRMDTLILRNCKITGEIPPALAEPSFDNLDLSFNNLTGKVPPSLLSNTFLDYLNLNNNNLEGEIPNLTYSSQAGDFSFNKFTKGELENSTVQRVNYFNCCVTDEIPNTVSLQELTTGQFCKRSKERTSLYINCGGDEVTVNGSRYEKDNNISMFYVSNYSSPWAYTCSGASNSDFAKNLSCGIGFSDTTLYATARVCPVSLKYYGLCFRNGKYDVVLDFAEIEYNTNEDYSSLSKRIFDVYVQGNRVLTDYNIVDDARGPNKGVSRKFPAIHVTNNILEIHLYWAGKGTLVAFNGFNGVLISAISVTPCKSRLSPLEIALIAIASAVFLGLLVLALAWQQGWIGQKGLYKKCIDIRGKKVSILQVIKATQNFSTRNKLGEGGFGPVYKAKLVGHVVAVKKLSLHSKQGVEEFNRELYALKSLKHKNFVELYDGYSAHGYHLLIYEYMENRSLATILFDPNSKAKLNWEIRYKICKDIAIGLNFLHEEKRLSMTHGDIKAANILLDGEYNAKLSDFGLAKVYVENDRATVFKVGGTFGYMAPECTSGIFTDKADVYSFGVVLLEIISGQKNAQFKQVEEGKYLLDKAYVLHKANNIMELVDQDLKKYLHENKPSYDQAKSLLYLAMMCTSQSYTLRPSMSEVVSVIEGKKTIQQVSDDHTITSASASRQRIGSSSESVISQKNWTSSDISSTSTSTDVSTFTTTAIFVISDNDEKKEQVLPSSTLEISHE